ncbi:hypothetical protein FB451DRAFT_1399716 [Mycena latifolia]|nr:hypothetical protein FB451DRAFT_1399716 [Mycena latifolia]
MSWSSTATTPPLGKGGKIVTAQHSLLPSGSTIERCDFVISRLLDSALTYISVLGLPPDIDVQEIEGLQSQRCNLKCPEQPPLQRQIASRETPFPRLLGDGDGNRNKRTSKWTTAYASYAGTAFPTYAPSAG